MKTELKDRLLEYMETNLTPERKKHTEGVRKTARELALKYGADPEKADIAAIGHDFYRYMDGDDLNTFIVNHGLPDKYLNNPALAHSKIAAIRLRTDFGIEDQDILNAVSYHTTGRPGMSVLEKVIYLADAMEEGRNYPRVDEIREEARKGLDQGVLRSLINTREHVLAKGSFLDEDTVNTIKDLQGDRMTNRDYAMLAAEVLSKKKAQDMVLIDIGEKSGFADYFLIATGNTVRMINSLSDDVEEAMEQAELPAKSIEGKNVSEWILLDFGDLIVNLFTPEMREKYNIEKIWADCPIEQIEA
ncbi:MAG: bis(5'-nucleosyl)-tetraphosphatase (symmetrical) YqeK [Firmicutes bacterium]|nr:bis(5'-nucleosyl)-tetraphosphatase (symmetrical) YqeK [Bacillota bacterium]